jgi:hypothetical protein
VLPDVPPANTRTNTACITPTQYFPHYETLPKSSILSTLVQDEINDRIAVQKDCVKELETLFLKTPFHVRSALKINITIAFDLANDAAVLIGNDPSRTPALILGIDDRQELGCGTGVARDGSRGLGLLSPPVTLVQQPEILATSEFSQSAVSAAPANLIEQEHCPPDFTARFLDVLQPGSVPFLQPFPPAEFLRQTGEPEERYQTTV